jgi:hypothetical protein
MSGKASGVQGADCGDVDESVIDRTILLRAARWANKVAGNDDLRDDQEVLQVESFLTWAAESRYDEMTAWQKAVWDHLAIDRQVPIRGVAPGASTVASDLLGAAAYLREMGNSLRKTGELMINNKDADGGAYRLSQVRFYEVVARACERAAAEQRRRNGRVFVGYRVHWGDDYIALEERPVGGGGFTKDKNAALLFSCIGEARQRLAQENMGWIWHARIVRVYRVVKG